MSAGVTAIRALATTGALVALPMAQADAQEARASVDVVLGAGYSTNPFLVRTDGNGNRPSGSAVVDLTITPQVVFLEERGQAVLSGRYSRSEYLDRYNSAESYGINARGQHQFSQRLSGTADVAFDSSIIGQGGTGVVGVVNPNPGVDLGTPDIAVIGLNQRQNSLSSAVGLAWQATERDSFNANVRASRVDYGGNNALTSLTTTGGSLGYSRAISSRTRIGVQGVASWTDFNRPGFSGSSYQPQATLSYRLNERFYFSAAAGAVFITSNTDRGTSKATGLSGSLNGCREATRATACARLFSDAQATGLGDISRRYGGGLDYSYRIREHDTVRASVDYTQVTATSDTLQAPNVGFLSSSVSYERNVSRRIFGGASVAYRQAVGGGFSGSNDVTFRIFLRTRLGDRR